MGPEPTSVEKPDELWVAENSNRTRRLAGSPEMDLGLASRFRYLEAKARRIAPSGRGGWRRLVKLRMPGIDVQESDGVR